MMRVESDREFVIVRGNKVFSQRPGSKTVKIIDGRNIRNLKFWYRIMEFSPWLSGKLLQTIKPLANDWQQGFGLHEKTGRESAFVKCGYKALEASFWFVFDTFFTTKSHQ